MTWRLAQQQVNDDALDEALDGSSVWERTQLAHYMLGALAGHVDADTWAAILTRARRTAGLDREGVQRSASSA